MSAALFDLFLSFHREDEEPVRKLANALENRGISCFAAGLGRPDSASGLPKELDSAKILLAWGSAKYFQSRRCQAELAAAFIATSQDVNGAPERLLIVNAEAGVKHIYPIHLRDLIIAPAPNLPDSWDYEELSENLFHHLSLLNNRFVDICSLQSPELREAFDVTVAPAPKFEGRERELWEIHDILNGKYQSKDNLVIVSADSGQGKSALACEYAFRFGSAYPGGIFRISAAESRPAVGNSNHKSNSWLQVQLSAVANHYGIVANPEHLDVNTLSRQLGEKLSATQKPFLWIVDDIPDGLNGSEFRSLLAPNTSGALGKSLFLTRTRSYQQRAACLNLPPLSIEAALRLLFKDRVTSKEPQEIKSAIALIDDLGRHSLALSIASELAVNCDKKRQGRFTVLLSQLDNQGPKAEEIYPKFVNLLPQGSEIGISSALLLAIHLMNEPGRDLLRLAAILPNLTLSIEFAAECLKRSDLPTTGRRKQTFAFFITEPSFQILEGDIACKHAEEGARALEKFGLGFRTKHGFRVHEIALGFMETNDPEPIRKKALERGVLNCLEMLADARDPMRAWQQLAPIAFQARKLIFRPSNSTDPLEPVELARRVRLACLIAEMDTAKGNLHEGLIAYRVAGNHLMKAMTAEPGNGQRQKDFAVIKERIGDLLSNLEDLSGALDCYRKSLSIRFLTIQPGQAGKAREILRHHEKIANILDKTGDKSGALQSYQAAHSIIAELASKRGRTSTYQVVLANSFKRLADLYREFEDSKATLAALLAASEILEELSEQYPEQREYTRQLGIIKGLIGDQLLNARDVNGALDYYQSSLETAREFVVANPNCNDSLKYFAQSHDRVGNVYSAMHDRVLAARHFKAFITLMEIREDNVDLAPRELGVAHIKLGIALEGLQVPDLSSALNEYHTAIGILEKIITAQPGNALVAKDLDWVDRRVKWIEARTRKKK